MRIAVVTETWAPSVDGVVVRLENTVRELRAAGHEVMVVAPTTGTRLTGVHDGRATFADALRAHMAFLDATKVTLPGGARQRAFAKAVRARL